MRFYDLEKDIWIDSIEHGRYPRHPSRVSPLCRCERGVDHPGRQFVVPGGLHLRKTISEQVYIAQRIRLINLS